MHWGSWSAAAVVCGLLVQDCDVQQFWGIGLQDIRENSKFIELFTFINKILVIDSLCSTRFCITINKFWEREIKDWWISIIFYKKLQRLNNNKKINKAI
jgi:hypothetical protein